MTAPPTLSLGQCATLACLLEAIAPKPGNVHRGADFENLSFTDFAVSAAALCPLIETAAERPVGQTVLEAVRRTRELVGTNTNLGIVLLIAPLAAVPREQPLESGVRAVLRSLTAADAADVYAAINCASPGGLGKSNEMDVRDTPPSDLLTAMRMASERDSIAKQYATDFADVLGRVVPWLVDANVKMNLPLTQAIIHTQIRWLSENPDSLIARKCGLEVATRVSKMALGVLGGGEPGDEDYERRLADFDFWLRADGHRRNPGTTADLIAAALFVCFRDGLLSPPYR